MVDQAKVSRAAETGTQTEPASPDAMMGMKDP